MLDQRRLAVGPMGVRILLSLICKKTFSETPRKDARCTGGTRCSRSGVSLRR